MFENHEHWDNHWNALSSFSFIFTVIFCTWGWLFVRTCWTLQHELVQLWSGIRILFPFFMVFCFLWFFAGLLNWSCRLFFLLLKRRYADYALINTILISAMNQMEKIMAAYRKASKQWCSTQNKLAQGRAWSRAPGPPQAHPIFASLCGCVNLRNDPFSVVCNEILQWGNGAGSALWWDKTSGPEILN